jgi:hypothetical protein
MAIIVIAFKSTAVMTISFKLIIEVILSLYSHLSLITNLFELTFLFILYLQSVHKRAQLFH